MSHGGRLRCRFTSLPKNVGDCLNRARADIAYVVSNSSFQFRQDRI
jgi:hypothetical protein